MAHSQAVPDVSTKKGDSLGFFLYRQGHAIPFSIAWGLFFLFANPHAHTAREGALWMFIPMVIIFLWYLAFTQILPVVTAPVFESHFATVKDIGVSIWLPIVTALMIVLSLTLGVVEVFGLRLDIEMTSIEWGIACMLFIAFFIDGMGAIFGLLKNRLASEEGMGRMPG